MSFCPVERPVFRSGGSECCARRRFREQGACTICAGGKLEDSYPRNFAERPSTVSSGIGDLLAVDQISSSTGFWKMAPGCRVTI